MPRGLQLKEFPRRFGSHDKMNKMQQHTESRLLNCMININYTKSNHVQTDIAKLRSTIRSSIPSLWNWLCNLMNTMRNIVHLKISQTQKEKFKNLMEKNVDQYLNKVYQTNKDLLCKPTINNMSSRPLTKFEEQLLNLGLNFSLPVKNVGYTMCDTAATIELRMMDIELTDHQKIKSGLG